MTSLPTTPASNDAAALNLEQMPITQHLIILRKHLFKVVAVLIGLFFCLLPFANQTYQWLSEPLRAQLPTSSTMIATDVTATFMAPFKLNFFVALMIAMPFILYQPGLAASDRQYRAVLYRHQLCLLCGIALDSAFFYQCFT
jgi:sec-independent protein translocase protein TatC